MKNVYEYAIKRTYVGRVGEDSAMYQVKEPDSVDTYLRALDLHTKEQEEITVLFLDTKKHIKGYQTVSRGLLDRTYGHPREVFRAAIMNGCSQIILIHNHPSGDTSPSFGDLRLTRRMVEAGVTVGIAVLDHIIVAEDVGQYVSRSLRVHDPELFETN
jgi:DNA repair protein RadC